MFSRILVPTDFSPPSDAALEYAHPGRAVRIVAAHFLHVIDDPTAASEFVADGFAPSTEDIRTGLLEHGRKRLEQLMNLVDRSRATRMPTWSWDRRPRQSSTTRRRPATKSHRDGHPRPDRPRAPTDGQRRRAGRCETAPCSVLTVRQVTVADEAVAYVTGMRVPIAV